MVTEIGRDKNVGVSGEDLNIIIKTVQSGAEEAVTKAAAAVFERSLGTFKEILKEVSKRQTFAREGKLTRAEAIVPPDPKKIEMSHAGFVN